MIGTLSWTARVGMVGAAVGLLMMPVQGQEVGIGVVAPTARLDIQVPSSYANDLLRIAKGGQVVWKVHSSGRVGVAVTSPQGAFHVGGRSGGDEFVLGDPTTPPDSGIDIVNHAEMDFTSRRSQNTFLGWERSFGLYADSSRRLLWIIENVGEVGIGTAAPQDRLHVEGDLRLSGGGRSIRGAADARFHIYNNTGAYDSRAWIELWGADSTRNGELALAGTYIDVRYASNPASIGQNGMRLASSGRWGVGTLDPISRLHVADDGMIYAEGTYGSGASIPGGPKTAFIWNPRKAAVRAGRVTGPQWDAPNVGIYSAAFGLDGRASATYSVIGGGKNHTVSAIRGTVGGGDSNQVGGAEASIGGGKKNAADHHAAMVGGGGYNTASGLYSVVMGGRNNQASGTMSVILGGRDNQALGYASTVPGGINNRAGGDYSFAGGRGMWLGSSAEGTFAWGHNTSSSPTLITTSYAFLVGPTGDTYRFGINTHSPTYALELLNHSSSNVGRAIAYAWATYSDRRVKSHIRSIKDPIRRIQALRPVHYFHHDSRQDSAGMLHVLPSGRPAYGFVAQELVKVVPEAVDSFADPRTLWGVNYAMLIPLLTAAYHQQQALIEALHAKLEELESRRIPTSALDALARQNARLEERIRRLETQINHP